MAWLLLTVITKVYTKFEAGRYEKCALNRGRLMSESKVVDKVGKENESVIVSLKRNLGL